MTDAGSVPGPRSSLRTRLTTTLVALVVGALVLAGVGTLVLTRVDARRTDERQLAEQVTAFAALLLAAEATDGPVADTDAPNFERAVRARLIDAFDLSDVARLAIARDGALVGPLPGSVQPDDLDTGVLLAGQTVSGRHGDEVFAAAPVRHPARPRLPAVGLVVATRQVDPGFGTAGRWFLLAAAVTVAVAVAVAAGLARRLAHPVGAAREVTHRIAAGDLGARLAPADMPDAETAALATSINAMAADLDRQRRLERQFLMSVSHDLRTPLTAIQGYAEAIIDGAKPPDDAAAVIQAESQRLERLVRDLLDLARLDAHRFELDLQEVDAGSAAAATAEALEPRAQAAAIVIETEATEGLVVRADPDRLAQVVGNLVENALKFAASRVRVSAESAGADVVIAVDDDGPGIDPADLPHVFDRLYASARTPAREVGTGLGLAIVADLTEAMGGTTHAGPSHLGGARLEVRLPAAE